MTCIWSESVVDMVREWEAVRSCINKLQVSISDHSFVSVSIEGFQCLVLFLAMANGSYSTFLSFPSCRPLHSCALSFPAFLSFSVDLFLLGCRWKYGIVSWICCLFETFFACHVHVFWCPNWFNDIGHRSWMWWAYCDHSSGPTNKQSFS